MRRLDDHITISIRRTDYGRYIAVTIDAEGLTHYGSEHDAPVAAAADGISWVARNTRTQELWESPPVQDEADYGANDEGDSMTDAEADEDYGMFSDDDGRY